MKIRQISLNLLAIEFESKIASSLESSQQSSFKPQTTIWSIILQPDRLIKPTIPVHLSVDRGVSIIIKRLKVEPVREGPWSTSKYIDVIHTQGYPKASKYSTMPGLNKFLFSLPFQVHEQSLEQLQKNIEIHPAIADILKSWAFQVEQLTMRNKNQNNKKKHSFSSCSATMKQWHGSFDITGRIHDLVIHLPSSLTPNDTNLYGPAGAHGTPSSYHQKYKCT